MQTSTLVAFAENSEKFVPFPSQVAPRGWGEPSRILDFMFSAKVVPSANILKCTLAATSKPNCKLTKARHNPIYAEHQWSGKSARSLYSYRFSRAFHVN